MTPAMAAGVSDHVWSIEEMVSLLDANVVRNEARPRESSALIFKLNANCAPRLKRGESYLLSGSLHSRLIGLLALGVGSRLDPVWRRAN